MLISYQWLKEYIQLDDLTPEEAAEKLTLHGVEVDAVHHKGEDITNLVTGRVVSCAQHPDADKLSLCQVDVGEADPVQIVCGAPNVAEGQDVAVARVGGRLPGGMKIKRAKLRGQVSEGMICSLQELGWEGKVVPKKYSEGIFVFPEPVVPGMDAKPLLGLDDTILELDLTPNRSDCLSMLGTAYEMAAVLDREVKLPDPQIVPSAEETAAYIRVDVQSPAANPYYGALMLRDLQVGESPLWLQTSLMAAGVRPLNNIVDITNYVLLEYGQPLHAFDYDQFGSEKVVVRQAQEGETMTTLDGEERTLNAHHLVITNGTKPTAIAGVMGGSDAEVEDATTNVLLEAAYFDPGVVRYAQRDLGIRSDSSIRFEKGVDPNRTAEAGRRAASLMKQLAGGEILAEPSEHDTLHRQPLELDVSLARINRALGTSLTIEEVSAILKRLQFPAEQTDEDLLAVTVPTRRQDIAIEPDIVEEVARLYGYDNIPVTLPNTPATQGGLSLEQKKKRQVRRFLESCGLHEAVSYSLTTEEKEAPLVPENRLRVPVALPMSEDRSSLRTTLVPHLLDALSHNKNRSRQHVSLFEIGSVFFTEEEEITRQPDERTYAAGAMMGLWEEHAWQGEKKPVDFFVLKGVLEGLAAELQIDAVFEAAERPGLHPGRTAVIKNGGRIIGTAGQLHPDTAAAWSLPETYVFELDLQYLLEQQAEVMKYVPIPRYPAVDRDIALVVDTHVSAADMKQVIEEAGGDLLDSASVFDVYEGEHVEAGKKSVAFTLKYLDRGRTLTEEDVTAVHENILAALNKQTGAVLRG